MGSEDRSLQHLQWTSYSTNWHRALTTLRTTGQFCDVTIVVDDGHLTAHRMVLTSCSPILARTLSVCFHPHPAIVLRGVNMAQMKGILDFMYMGEASLEEDLLESFLEAAKELCITGLVEDTSKTEAVEEDIVERSPQKRPLSAPASTFLKPKTTDNEVGKVKRPKSRKLKKDKQKIDVVGGNSFDGDSREEISPPSKKTKRETDMGEKITESENGIHKDFIPEKKKLADSPKKSRVHPNLDMLQNEELTVTVSPLKKKANDSPSNLVRNDQNIKPISPPKGPTPPASPDDISSGNKTIMTNLPEDRVKLRDIWDTMISSPEEIDGETVYSCLSCDKTFKGKSAKSNAWSHVDHNHTPQIEHRCHICNFISKSNDGVSRHITKTHKKDQAKKEDQREEMCDKDMIVLD